MSPNPSNTPKGEPRSQIGVPRPPLRCDDDYGIVDVRPHAESVVESYQSNIVRICPEGVGHPAVELVPVSGEGGDGPDQLFGEGCGPVYVISGSQPFGRLSTFDENARSLEKLYWRLGFDSWNWVPTVTTSPARGWVEKGAAVLGVSEEDALFRAGRQGQSVVLRWDSDGLLPLAAKSGVEVGVDEPVAVRIQPALTGCPLRRGADEECTMVGGPWTSSSISAAFFWQQHRELLLDAFGCDVCGGEARGGARGAVELFAPSREGGWQRGLPMTVDEMSQQP
ncbi:MAG: DUF3293 domain-containing protein [Propionibacteriaceae bacterium]|nr:DUF3293 domain-containing protein [Propionibacteriaceae bacterium]